MAVELLGAGNDRVEFGDPAAIAGLAGFTIAITLLPDNNTDALRLVGQWGPVSTDQAFLTAAAAAQRPGLVLDGPGGYFGRYCDDLVLVAGTVTRMVFTWVNDTPNVIHVWVNGVDEAVSEWVGSTNRSSIQNSTRPVAVGHEAPTPLDGNDGDYSELAIWDHVVPDWVAIAYGQGMSPRFYRNGGILYCPLWDASHLKDEWGGISGAGTGAADAVHPRIFYPASPSVSISGVAPPHVPDVFGDHLSSIPVKCDVGTGAPTHSADEGTFYWAADLNTLYMNNDGATGWTVIQHNKVHDILSTADHDASGGTPVRGDLLVVNASLLWERVAKGTFRDVFTQGVLDGGWLPIYGSHIMVFSSENDTPSINDIVDGFSNGICVGESGEHGTFIATRAKATAKTAGVGINTLVVEADDNPAFSSATTLFTLALATSTEVDDTVLDNPWASGDIHIRARWSAVGSTAPERARVTFYFKEQVYNF